MIKQLLVSLITIFLISCSGKNDIIQLETSNLTLSVNEAGTISSIVDKLNNIDHLSRDTSSYLLSVKKEGVIYTPIYAERNEGENIIILTFPQNILASIKYEKHDEYIKFDLISVNDNGLDMVIWGPYFTDLNNTIGETVGVVQGEIFSVGLQSLNPKTLGGFPWTDNDCMPQINIFDQDDLSDMSEEGKEHVLYRVEAAKPTEQGSSLQAYCRNRDEERVIKNLNHNHFISPRFDDGGVIGSSIALFGTSRDKILPTIAKIEISEDLPHPQLEGEWNKVSKAAARAYLIHDFSEQTIERAIQLTKQAGLKYLYHGNPFETWGHFELNKIHFPNGITGLKKCVEKANREGVQVGIHTLSNFITTNDRYVTPIPDKRLAAVGSSVLSEDITEQQKSIQIDDPKFFDQFENNNLRTVMINEELIRYGDVVNKNGWYLVDCERGAFGTVPSGHLKGAVTSKLADHGYKVFLSNPELSLEIAQNLAVLFNKTGLRQISFDGLEGNRSTGMGNYGEILFTKTWYDNLADNIKTSFIADASRTSHFFWHLYTRMNWGEPWYAGFRESQTEYRLKNQSYFQRNLMPGMLGWFQLRPQTSIEDVEWMLARSAAFDAGYAFVVSNKALAENNHSCKIFELISLWEEARLSGAFTVEQKEEMKNISNEFRLIENSDGDLEFSQIYSYKFVHERKIRQPGEPLFSTFKISNPGSKKSMELIIKCVNSGIENILFEIDSYKKIPLNVKLGESEVLKYDGSNKAIVYDQFWKKLREIPMDHIDWEIGNGDHNFMFDCEFTKETGANVKLELRIPGESDKIILN